MGELADWKCHKVVKAGRILELPRILAAGHEPLLSCALTVEDCNGAACAVEMPKEAFTRSKPIVGDYVVIYEDGYKSWSPAKAFEDGYTRVVPGEPTEMKRLADRITIRLGNRLLEMEAGYDDSVTGFNEAWDIVRKAMTENAFGEPG